MAEVEIDLQMLEEMCSDLEEDAILLDKDINVVWINSVLKNHLNTDIKDCFTDSAIIKNHCKNLFGINFNDASIISKVFSTGKLLKHNVNHHKNKIKIITIPIKNSSEVIYSLNIIEKLPEESYFPAHADHDLSEKLDQPDSESQGSDHPKKTGRVHDALVKHFINNIKNPCFISDAGNVIAVNKSFTKQFEKNHAIHKFIYDNVQIYNKDIKSLQALFKYSFSISRKKIVNDAETLFLYEFKRVNRKAKNKRYNVRNLNANKKNRHLKHKHSKHSHTKFKIKKRLKRRNK
ncbi:TPA: hypothetical protein HA235_00210 [Candidatus Woesearchaeota archaeon]|nr:hypothetical protein [Candidatus Woesearchaeota archaeon]HIH31108.1 hypothetical protein [Candidatus Woesearchaeota archaeon]HIH55616.1 hypothetical protein [Candidatus Woesearchaeota archaeon]HIJ01195.1 hypothetical protein [Candidatus Woesearchaeota archaeon]HIJ14477.1 hypothetical protein [Candidatus Woesearchaeota archaeon]